MNSSNNFGFKPINKNIQESKFIPMQNETSSENEFGFQPIERNESEKKEGFLKSSIRQATGNMARVLESALGSAGEFSEIANSITEPLANFLIPIEKEKKEKLGLKKLPTTKDIRSFSKEKTGGYLEPKGKIEESMHEASELLGSIIGPAKFRKTLGLAVGSQLAKEGLKLFGATPTQQEAGKFGTLLTLSMINPNGVKKFWSNLYDKRDALTPAGTFVNAQHLEKEANDIIQQIKKGTIAPSQAKVLDQAEKIIKKIEKPKVVKKKNVNPNAGNVDLNEMLAVKRSLNEIAGDPELFKRGQHLFPKLQKAVDQTIALHPDKQAVKYHQMANEAFGAFHESQKLSRSIKNIIGDKPLKSVMLSAGIEAIAGHPEAIIPTIVGSAAAAGIVKGYELLNRINANPTLRKYYMDLLINSSKGNLVAAQKSLRKLDQEMYKKESNQRPE